jgi:hypothetical protein
MFEATFDFVLSTELRTPILDESAGSLTLRPGYPPEAWLLKRCEVREMVVAVKLV